MKRWTQATAISLLATAVACTDTTGPGGDLVDVMLDFCTGDVPAFFAYQNDGGPWTPLSPDASGTVAFQAADRVVLAIVHQQGAEFSSEFIFATPDDLEPLSGVSCIDEIGTKTLNGTVSNVPMGSAAMISVAGDFEYLTAPSNAFSLTQLPTGPRDVIAHREVVGAGSVTPDRVIVRRAQDFVSGASLPVLDFAGNEAQNVTPHSFTATGLSASDDKYFLLTFNTATTRRHSLSTLMQFTSATQTLHGIPAALTQAGDFHELEVFADQGALYRGEVQFYRTAGNRSVTLGAQMSNPTLTTVATSPRLRLRTQVSSQSEYGAFITVAHVQPSREVVLTATNSWFGGTPITWDLTIPDMSGVTGFPSGAGLVSGAGTDWYVDVYGGTGGLRAYYGSPADGTTLRYAGRAFTTDARVLRTTRGAESGPRRPRRHL